MVQQHNVCKTVLFSLSLSQEFDPQEFSSTLNDATQDADPGMVLNFMTSSHMPFILNRLQISLEADDEGMYIYIALALCI